MTGYDATRVQPQKSYSRDLKVVIHPHSYPLTTPPGGFYPQGYPFTGPIHRNKVVGCLAAEDIIHVNGFYTSIART